LCHKSLPRKKKDFRRVLGKVGEGDRGEFGECGLWYALLHPGVGSGENQIDRGGGGEKNPKNKSVRKGGIQKSRS